jgi:DHA1 family tetracycline resistance protein-like MFS transporter
MKNRKLIYTVLFLTVFIDTIGDGLIVPLVPFYGLKFDAAPGTIALLFSTYSLSQLLATTFWGIMSDRFGRRPMLLLSLIGSGCAYFSLSQATAIWMLFASRILEGSMTVSILLASIYISDITTKENRTKSMGIIGAASGLGCFIGPGLSSTLVGNDPNNPNLMSPCLIAAGMALLGFFIAWFALPESKPPEVTAKVRSPQQSFHWSTVPEFFQPPPVTLLILSTFLVTFSLTGVFTIFPLWIQQQSHWGPKEIGYVYMLWGILCVLVQSVVVGQICRRYGEAKALLIGAILAAFGLFLMPFSSHIGLILGSLMMQVTGFNICRPAVLNSLLSQAAGAKRQAKILSFSGSMGALACTISPVFSGLIFGHFGHFSLFWTHTILMAIVSIIGWKVATSSQLSTAAYLQRQRRMKRLFDLLDYDKNGLIELADFEQVIKTITEIRNLKVGSPDYWLVHSYWTGLYEKLQTLMDRDRDGKITPEEWLEYMGRRLDRDFVNMFFQLIDTDSSGEIELHELKMFYQTYKIGTTQEAEGAFAAFDLNQDGYISLEEMKEIFDQFMYNDRPEIQSPWSIW